MDKPLELLLRNVPLLKFIQRPPLGYFKLLFRNGVLKIKDDTGTETSVGGGSTGYIRKSETFYAPSYISYLAFAPTGSLETDTVWTITKRVGSADGTIISNVQYLLKKWTERGLL